MYLSILKEIYTSYIIYLTYLISINALKMIFSVDIYIPNIVIYLINPLIFMDQYSLNLFITLIITHPNTNIVIHATNISNVLKIKSVLLKPTLFNLNLRLLLSWTSIKFDKRNFYFNCSIIGINGNDIIICLRNQVRQEG